MGRDALATVLALVGLVFEWRLVVVFVVTVVVVLVDNFGFRFVDGLGFLSLVDDLGLFALVNNNWFRRWGRRRCLYVNPLARDDSRPDLSRGLSQRRRTRSSLRRDIGTFVLDSDAVARDDALTRSDDLAKVDEWGCGDHERFFHLFLQSNVT